MEALNAISGLVILVLMIFMFCVPFFVLKIRNRVINMDLNLSKIVILLENQSKRKD